MTARAKRPAGQPTRGKTAPNRLRRLDAFLCQEEATLLSRRGAGWERAAFVDLGFGAWPLTTVEAADRFRRLNPTLPVVGLEIDRERVAAAQAHATEGVEFRHGGFEIPRGPGETVRLIRAMNVLRQYEESAVPAAWAEMAAALLPGGLLVEGTSDPFGRHMVVNLLRARSGGLAREALLFAVGFREQFSPDALQPVLPKNLIHRVVPGEPIHAFFEAWTAAWRTSLAWRDFGPRELFVKTGQALAERVPGVDRRVRLLRRGWLLWRLDDR